VKSSITIGNAGGYWGDDPNALLRQVEGGRLDYISIDFLAEITMSIMQKQRSRDPSAGFARDFLPMLEQVLGTLMDRKTVIITNAGGVNPEGCAEAIGRMAQQLGLKPRISVVYGDDILQRIPELQASGENFRNMESGEGFEDVADRVRAANVYFGAWPVVEALKDQPHIIITGRVTDTGITLAPMIHEFGWKQNDWNKLAAGIVAGHLIECGSQATGGNFTDWRKVKSFDNIGYPIVEVYPDSSFVLTKHPGTGGLVSVDTAREQLFYEMGTPNSYITPDVVADFSTIQLQQDGPDRVRVSGVMGCEPTPLYKVSMAYADGFKAQGQILISGPDARDKSELFADIFWRRCANLNFTERGTEHVGWNACHRSIGHRQDGNEIILKLSARADEQEPLKIFSKLVPSLILGGPAGVAVLGGAPKVQEVVSYWPALIPKTKVAARIATYADGKRADRALPPQIEGKFEQRPAEHDRADAPSQSLQQLLKKHDEAQAIPLSRICLGRSGDKGDTCNIGIMARSDAAYDFLKQHLTAQLVKDWFQELCDGPVIRYPVPSLKGFNFLLEQSLGGGGTRTLRSDAQGKTFAQALLRQRMFIPESVLRSVGADSE
jgi:hypothetical protein